jgi:RND family efflux transporter MFP subunit
MHDVRTRDESHALDLRAGQPTDRKTENLPSLKARRRWGGSLVALGAFSLLAGGVALGASRHYAQHQQVLAAAERERDFVPSVRVATVTANPGIVSVTLPGTTAAFADANIYARATGYIAKRNVDIGDRVKQGELLAQLAVPELDDQISQNEATLAQLKSALEQAKANLTLAQVTWDRDRPLVKEGWTTQQQGTVDVQTLKAQEAAVSIAQSNVASQENLLRVLRQNRDYAYVVAPFDGVITQRNVDIGSLVQGNTNSGTFMFEIMQKDVIRVWVYVPQDAAFGVAPGIDAIVRVPELPDREFPGKVTRIADALQSGTRTLLTEIDIPNPDGALPPGVYCSVELKIPRKAPSLVVPAEALIFDRDGLQVALVDNGKSEIRQVRVTRDLGTQVEVDAGVKPGDRVILNPPVTLIDGSKVQLRPEVTPSPTPAVPTTRLRPQ